ncbi:MAG: hypothetical protein ACLTZT_13845 [Butyricimonas faecalis]
MNRQQGNAFLHGRHEWIRGRADVCELMIRLAKDRGVRGERFVLCGGNYSYRELFTVIARVVGKRPPCIRMTPWMTGLAWRLLAFVALFTGKKPAFTKETARSSQHKSRYSSAKYCLFFPISIFIRLKRRPVFSKICNNSFKGSCRAIDRRFVISMDNLLNSRSIII